MLSESTANFQSCVKEISLFALLLTSSYFKQKKLKGKFLRLHTFDFP